MNAMVITNFTQASVAMSEAAQAVFALSEQKLLEAKEIKAKDSKQSGLKALADGRSDEFRLNPFFIGVKDGWNNRSMDDPANHAHIDTLARSIASEGVHTALRVYWENDRPYLVDGHCRLLAVFRAMNVYGARVETVPVKNMPKGTNEIDRVFMQETGNLSKQFTPVERAALFAKLVRLGASVDQIAERSGLSVTQVDNMLTLNSAPVAIKTMVAAKQISATTATEIVKHSGSDAAAIETAEKALQKAQASGKEKVTAKHVDVIAKKSPRKVLRTVFEEAKKKESGDEVVVRFTRAQYDEIMAVLKMKAN
jgi:hypothetical protein